MELKLQSRPGSLAGGCPTSAGIDQYFNCVPNNKISWDLYNYLRQVKLLNKIQKSDVVITHVDYFSCITNNNKYELTHCNQQIKPGIISDV